jgi:hypothetical protein
VSIKTAIPLQDFKSTIASACEFIGLANFIAMAQLARANDPRAERFIDAWDALDASEQQARGSADAICKRVGLTPIELLRVVAETTFRFSTYTARITASLALPAIVERSVEVALTDEGVADRRMLFVHSGFLPTPKGSQIAVTQIVQANAAPPTVLCAPRPEETIQTLTSRLNAARKLPSLPAVALPGTTNGGGDDGK